MPAQNRNDSNMEFDFTREYIHISTTKNGEPMEAEGKNSGDMKENAKDKAQATEDKTKGNMKDGKDHLQEWMRDAIDRAEETKQVALTKKLDMESAQDEKDGDEGNFIETKNKSNKDKQAGNNTLQGLMSGVMGTVMEIKVLVKKLHTHDEEDNDKDKTADVRDKMGEIQEGAHSLQNEKPEAKDKIVSTSDVTIEKMYEGAKTAQDWMDDATGKDAEAKVASEGAYTSQDETPEAGDRTEHVIVPPLVEKYEHWIDEVKDKTIRDETHKTSQEGKSTGQGHMGGSNDDAAESVDEASKKTRDGANTAQDWMDETIDIARLENAKMETLQEGESTSQGHMGGSNDYTVESVDGTSGKAQDRTITIRGLLNGTKGIIVTPDEATIGMLQDGEDNAQDQTGGSNDMIMGSADTVRVYANDASISTQDWISITEATLENLLKGKENNQDQMNEFYAKTMELIDAASEKTRNPPTSIHIVKKETTTYINLPKEKYDEHDFMGQITEKNHVKYDLVDHLGNKAHDENGNETSEKQKSKMKEVGKRLKKKLSEARKGVKNIIHKHDE